MLVLAAQTYRLCHMHPGREAGERPVGEASQSSFYALSENLQYAARWSDVGDERQVHLTVAFNGPLQELYWTSPRERPCGR